MQVVQNARRAAAETSGAMSGARVAAYLRGEAEEKPAGDRLLERLSAPQAAPSVPAPAAAPVETVDEQKLAALAQAGEAASPPSPPAAAPEKTAELEEANEKLSSLLGKPKDQ